MVNLFIFEKKENLLQMIKNYLVYLDFFNHQKQNFKYIADKISN